MPAKKKTEPEELSFEDALRRLEDIVTRLEGGDTSLEESLRLFEDGVTSARRCQELLNEAEKRVTMLLGDEDPVEVDFETGEVIDDDWDDEDEDV